MVDLQNFKLTIPHFQKFQNFQAFLIFEFVLLSLLVAMGFEINLNLNRQILESYSSAASLCLSRRKLHGPEEEWQLHNPPFM